MRAHVFNKAKPYLFLTPAAIFFIVFIAVPIFYTIYLSFFDWNMVKPEMDFVGLSNYTDLLYDEDFQVVMVNTVLYIILLVLINFCTPFVFAFVCRFVFVKWKKFYKVSLFLPGFISLVVGSIIFTWILNPVAGPVSMLMELIGLEMPVWSKTEGLVIVVISLITSWKSFGYNFIMLLAAVSGVSEEVIEAARLDGISMPKIFIDIVAPMSGATSFYIFIMTIVQGLTYVFSPIEVLTEGGPNYASSNIIYDAYFRAFRLFETGEAAAVSVIALLVFGVCLFVLNEVVGKKVYYEN